METISKWDAAECINTKEVALEYLKVAIAEHDLPFLQEAIEDLARSKGGKALALEYNLTWENLPVTTLIKLLDTLGFQLDVIQKKAS